MITLTSILYDLLGAVLVVSALIVAAVIIKLIVIAVEKARNKNIIEIEEVQEPAAAPVCTNNGLKLINVDEKTAALIMAIVSHESGIPLSELAFTSIKLV